MGEDIYRKLAKVMDTLPNGFPATETGLELRILGKMFTPEEADLFCDLRLTYETAEEIAERTGRPLEGLEDLLTRMWERCVCSGLEEGGVKRFKMVPWVVGLYEMQLSRMDREFAEMCEAYSPFFSMQLAQHGPRLLQVLPIETEISARQETLPYEQVSRIIENGTEFVLNNCICKTEKRLMDNPCEKPVDVCLVIRTEGSMDGFRLPEGKFITKQEAYDVLERAEKAGLVHMTSNVRNGHWFICNCCGCCCKALRAINRIGSNVAINAHYYAAIDPDACTACGVCADERCQVNAIEEEGEVYKVLLDRCIGCGLCVTTCPAEAIQMIRKPEADILTPEENEASWMEARARQRGVDYSIYK